MHLRPSKCILHLSSAGCSRRPRHSQSTSTSAGPATKHSNSAISPAPTSTSCRGASTARDRLSGCAGRKVATGGTHGAETHRARETHMHTHTGTDRHRKRDAFFFPLERGKAHPPSQPGQQGATRPGFTMAIQGGPGRVNLGSSRESRAGKLRGLCRGRDGGGKKTQHTSWVQTGLYLS